MTDRSEYMSAADLAIADAMEEEFERLEALEDEDTSAMMADLMDMFAP